MNTHSPADFLATGILFIVVSGIAAGAGFATGYQAVGIAVSVFAGIAGQILTAIGVIGFGVAAGMRHAQQSPQSERRSYR